MKTTRRTFLTSGAALAVGALALLAAPYQELLMLWDVPIEYELAQEAS